MNKSMKSHTRCCSGFVDLRVQDLIARTAHVQLKEALRVLVALSAVCKEYDMEPGTVIGLRFSAETPTPRQAWQCETAYAWMHDSVDVAKALFEIEQLV